MKYFYVNALFLELSASSQGQLVKIGKKNPLVAQRRFSVYIYRNGALDHLENGPNAANRARASK
jgi:hypothetical protein